MVRRAKRVVIMNMGNSIALDLYSFKKHQPEIS